MARSGTVKIPAETFTRLAALKAALEAVLDLPDTSWPVTASWVPLLVSASALTAKVGSLALDRAGQDGAGSDQVFAAAHIAGMVQDMPRRLDEIVSVLVEAAANADEPAPTTARA